MTILNFYDVSFPDRFLNIILGETKFCSLCSDRWEFIVFMKVFMRHTRWLPSGIFLCSAHSHLYQYGVSRDTVESEEFEIYIEFLKIVSS